MEERRGEETERGEGMFQQERNPRNIVITTVTHMQEIPNMVPCIYHLLPPTLQGE